MKYERFTVSDIIDMGGIDIHEFSTGYDYELRLRKNRESKIAWIAISGGQLGSRKAFFGEYVNPDYVGDEYQAKYFENEQIFLELGVHITNGDTLHIPVGEAYITIRNFIISRVVENNLAQKNNIEELKD